MKKVLVPLAEGCEEMEAVILIDVFRRAGWEVTAAGVGGDPIVCSRGVRIVPDLPFEQVDADGFDVLAIPGGGPGTDVLRKREDVLEAVRAFHRADKWIAAVCAGPLVLQEAGILERRMVTCHPDMAGELTQTGRSAERVVRDGRLITSQGPGTTFEFALEVVAAVEGRAKADALAAAMVLPS